MDEELCLRVRGFAVYVFKDIPALDRSQACASTALPWSLSPRPVPKGTYSLESFAQNYFGVENALELLQPAPNASEDKRKRSIEAWAVWAQLVYLGDHLLTTLVVDHVPGPTLLGSWLLLEALSQSCSALP